MNRRSGLAVAAAAAIAVAACSPSESTAPSASPEASPGASPGSSTSASSSESPGPSDHLRLQLAGPVDARAAGYVAAQVLGYYANDGLVLDLVPGGGSVDPVATGSAASGPEFTIAWQPAVFKARQGGSDLVNISQVFQRSDTVVMGWAATDLTSVCDLKGKSVGVWASPADVEVKAMLAACDVPASDYVAVPIQGDVTQLLDKGVDAIQGLGSDQEARILETINPATGKQYTTDDLRLFSPNDDRSAVIQDSIFARAAWLADATNRDIAVRFVEASLRGWVYCRDHQEDCVQFVLKAGTGLGTSHTRWMLNEVNALIWPSPNGIGVVDPIQWQQTISLSMAQGVVSQRPSAAAYDGSITTDALAALTDLDVNAADYVKEPSAVAPGGK
jgi:NitT/TauT family transport system substrate-binding protein